MLRSTQLLEDQQQQQLTSRCPTKDSHLSDIMMILFYYMVFLTLPYSSYGFLSSFLSRGNSNTVTGGTVGNLPNILKSDRGIATDTFQNYAGSTFSCDGITIPISKVNDNFCDCKDGIDEPGTSACRNGVFTCKNEGFQIVKIPSSRVDDGLCDCCDGSDEPSGVCPNDCDAVAAVERKAIEKFRNAYVVGSRIKKEQIASMERKIQVSRDTLEMLAPQLSEINAKIEQARTEREHELEIEKKEIAQLQDSFYHQINTLLNLDSISEERLAPFLELLFSLLDIIEEDIHELLQVKKPSSVSTNSVQEEHHVDFGDDIGHEDLGDYEDEYHPPHHEEETVSLDPPTEKSADEVVFYDQNNCPLLKFSSDERLHLLCPVYSGDSDPLHSVRQFLIQLILNRKPLKEMQLLLGYEFITGSFNGAKDFFHRILATTLPTENEQPHYCPLEFENHPQLCLLADKLNSILTSTDVAQYIRPEVKKLNELIEQLTHEQSDLQRIKADHDNVINESANYDPSNYDILASKGECFDRVDGAFTYTVCIGTKVTQKENGRGAGVNLGTFSNPQSSIILEEGSDGITGRMIPIYKLLYSNGQHCHAFGARKAEVLISCGEKNQILDASEPSTCSYSFKLESPIACTDEFAKVYGFNNE